MAKVYPGTAPARPPAPAADTPTPLVVDGRTHFVCRAPLLAPPAFARALRGEQVRFAFVASPTMGAAPVHSTLEGVAQHLPDDGYVRAFLARDLFLRLAPYAGQPVWVRVSSPPHGVCFLPYRVVWAVDAAFPLPES